MIKRHQKMQRNGLLSDKIYKQKAFDPQIIIIWVFYCININLLIYFRRIFGMGNLNYEQSGQNIIQVDFNPHETNSIQQIVPHQLSSQSIPLNHHLYDALNNHPTSNEQNYNIYELTSNASTNSNGINQIPRQMITYHNPRSDIDESCKLEQLSKISLQTEQNSRQQIDKRYLRRIKYLSIVAYKALRILFDCCNKQQLLFFHHMITTILQEANISLKNLPVRVAEVRALILRADASQILMLLQQVEKIMKEMDSYRQYIGNKIDALSMQSLQEIVSKQQGHQQDKLLLYLWQILNYLSINLQCLPSFIIDAIQTLVEFNIKYEYFYSENSIKNAEILVHNIISKLLKSKEHFFECQTKIISWLKLLLIHHYEQKDNQYTIFFKYSKKQQSFLGQFEWLGYIFNQLFSQKYFTLGEKRPSLVQKIIESSQNKDKISYYLLHSIGDYFQNIIDKRITTELVYTYEAEIQDIKDMYNKTNEKVLAQIKITQEDLSFICMILKAHLSRHRNLIKQYIYRRLDNTQSQQIARQFTTNEQIIQQIFHLLNCVLFIGGYNNKLQDVIISDILSEDKLLLNYLELTYLIYKNIEATRFKNKVSLLVQVEQTIKKQLFGLISYEEPIGDIDMKGIQLEKVLVNGQLVNVLRLFTNLVHINKNAIKPFEQQPKYLHIILSLTHDNVSQATMRQWAIMFIRNVSEWSQILRDEIGKVKIEMKVV